MFLDAIPIPLARLWPLNWKQVLTLRLGMTIRDLSLEGRVTVKYLWKYKTPLSRTPTPSWMFGLFGRQNANPRATHPQGLINLLQATTSRDRAWFIVSSTNYVLSERYFSGQSNTSGIGFGKNKVVLDLKELYKVYLCAKCPSFSLPPLQ